MSKRKPDGPPAPAPKTTHLTSRNPPWTYLKLQLCVSLFLLLNTNKMIS